jgi:LemA protein
MRCGRAQPVRGQVHPCLLAGVGASKIFKRDHENLLLNDLNLNDLLLITSPVLFIGVISLYFAYLYNRLFRYRNAADANLSQIRVALKKRLDMIEELLGAVKGYIRHERRIFESLASLRAKIFESGAEELNEIDRESRSITVSIQTLAEAYPDLKANETVKKLMDAIISVEEEIARHRYTYNNIVQTFNTMNDTIPSNIVANIAGHEKLDYLQFEGDVDESPYVTETSQR